MSRIGKTTETEIRLLITWGGKVGAKWRVRQIMPIGFPFRIMKML